MSVFLLWLCLLQTSQSAQPEASHEVVALVRAGIDAQSHHELDAAIADFRKATVLAPAYPEAFLRLGSAYMEKRDYSAATAPLRAAVGLDPDLLQAQQLLGFALLAQGYATEAIPHLDAAHEFGGLGIAQLQANLPSEAVENLQRALQKRPGDPDLLYYLSQAASALSAQSLDRLLSSYPDSPRAHEAFGQNLYSLKMYDRAAKEYERALSLRPDLPGLHLELGQVYADASQWEKAEVQFRAAVGLQPGNAEAAYRLGATLLHEGRMEEAISQLKRANELRPDMTETLYLLGKACATGDPVLAEKSLDRVVELEKESPLAGQAYLQLANLHRKLGKTDLAAKETQEFRHIQSLMAARSNAEH